MASAAIPPILTAAVIMAERSTSRLPTRFTAAAEAMARTARTGTHMPGSLTSKARRR